MTAAGVLKEMQDLIGRSLDAGDWVVNHPARTGERLLLKEQTDSELTFVSEREDFKIEIPVAWYEMSSSKTRDYLLSEVQSLPNSVATAWACDVKYTHPTYWHCQELERKESKEVTVAAIGRALNIIGKPLEEVRVCIVGANRGIDIDYLPRAIKQENILAIDVSRHALGRLSRDYPLVKCLPEFVERIVASTRSGGLGCFLNGSTINPSDLQSYDLCLAFRTLQSSNILAEASRVWQALTRIRDLLSEGGVLLASFPKSTVTLNGNKLAGIQRGKEGSFDEKAPRQDLLTLVDQLTNGSDMFVNVTPHFGKPLDIELFLLAERWL